MTFSPQDFGGGFVRILRGLAAVQLRPAMYIGTIDDGTGLHNMVLATVNGALGTRSGPGADLIAVTLNADGSCTVSDNGPGLSGEPDRREGVSEVELVMTRLRRHEETGDHEKAPLCAVNALSHWLRVETGNGRKVYDLEFRHAVPISPLGVREDTGTWHGTRISFLPSADVFAERIFDRARLQARLDVISRQSSARIDLSDARGAPNA